MPSRSDSNDEITALYTAFDINGILDMPELPIMGDSDGCTLVCGGGIGGQLTVGLYKVDGSSPILGFRSGTSSSYISPSKLGLKAPSFRPPNNAYRLHP